TGKDVLSEIEQRSKEIAYLPALIIFGDTDATYKVGWHERFARMFPKHSMDVLKGGHHFPQEYAPDYFAAAIRRWHERLDQKNTSSGNSHQALLPSEGEFDDRCSSYSG